MPLADPFHVGILHRAGDSGADPNTHSGECSRRCNGRHREREGGAVCLTCGTWIWQAPSQGPTQWPTQLPTGVSQCWLASNSLQREAGAGSGVQPSRALMRHPAPTVQIKP